MGFTFEKLHTIVPDSPEVIYQIANLYDLNGDGFISLEEMTSYLTCVFRMLYQLQPGTSEQMGVSANELGAATAAQAFEDADLNHDGRISFDEFREFYLQSNNVTAEEEGDGEEYPGLQMNLNVAKQLSCLHHYHVEDVFTEFANYANEDGLLDRRTFTKCFSQLILATDTLRQREEALSLSLIDGIFDIFDTDGNGRISLEEFRRLT